jgi:dihydrolipoamide dehydrogenase
MKQWRRRRGRFFTRDQGLNIVLGTSIARVTPGDKGRHRRIRRKDGGEQKIDFDRLIVSIGRVPNTRGLGAEKIASSWMRVASSRSTRSVAPVSPASGRSGTWSAGPCSRTSEEEGVAVAERIAGRHGHVDFNTIPWVIYTAPEIAWVGRTEQQLKSEGVEYRAGQFPFMANGRARALGDTRGFVKFLADAATDRVLGVHIIGPMASEMIAEAVVAMEFRAASEDIALICHAHPSLSEAMKEAALSVHKRTLNS